MEEMDDEIVNIPSSYIILVVKQCPLDDGCQGIMPPSHRSGPGDGGLSAALGHPVPGRD